MNKELQVGDIVKVIPHQIGRCNLECAFFNEEMARLIGTRWQVTHCYLPGLNLKDVRWNFSSCMVKKVRKGTCQDCFKTVHKINRKYLNNTSNFVCPSCFKNYSDCYQCDDKFLRNSLTLQDCKYFCHSCFENLYTQCTSCGDYILSENAAPCFNCDSTICENCTCSCDEESNLDEDFEPRNCQGFHAGSEYNGFHSMRLTGIEIETISQNYNRIELTESISEHIGCVEDSSLSDGGIEIVIPASSGDKLDEYLTETCEKLRELNFTVDSSCGLHIHLNGKEFKKSAKNSIKLLKTYHAIEPLIFSMLPSSRTGNQFCLPLESELISILSKRARNINSLEKLWYQESDDERKDERKQNKYDHTRYHGLNLHSLFYRGSVELRYHSGTINYSKIKNWINLHQEVIDFVLYKYKTKDISKINKAKSLKQRIKLSIKILSLSPKTEKYVLERIKTFRPSLYENITGVQQLPLESVGV